MKKLGIIQLNFLYAHNKGMVSVLQMPGGTFNYMNLHQPMSC